ncbi:MAG TPA: type II toxin-antitoxin system VapC family toxin [Anaeromyxobacteraceae bacterium]|nr:type II toxin-antitoxin system VapC family toxin [Anaeromyxobacteraceae bacterium]
MATAVVDASAVAAIVFAEPDGDRVVERLAGADLAAPSLLPYEVANVAALRVRRGLLSGRAAATAISIFERLGIGLHDADPADLLPLAAATGLTAYDASYLWLARALGADLVTLDRRLRMAFLGTG